MRKLTIVLVNSWETQSLIPIQTEPNANVNTDHYAMVATIRQRLKANEKTEPDINPKNVDTGPNANEKGNPNPLIVKFNEKVQEIFANKEISKDVGNFTNANKKAAIETFNIQPSREKDKTATQRWQLSLNKDYKQSHNTKKMKQSY